MPRIGNLHAQKSTSDGGRRKEEERNSLHKCICVWEGEEEAEGRSWPATHASDKWVPPAESDKEECRDYSGWLSRRSTLFVEFKELHVKISQTSGISHTSGARDNNKLKLNGKSTPPRYNITASVCSTPHHRPTYCNHLDPNSDLWERNVRGLLSTSHPRWPLPGSCCQLARFNNGSQVIRLSFHTLFTSRRTGRPLALILEIHPLKVKPETA